ncbi:MAG TPA: DUF642 domain-containing protein [Acidothermaceae bacterium]
MAVLALAAFAAGCGEAPTVPTRTMSTPAGHGASLDATPATSSNLVVNGSFEQPAITFSPTMYPWQTFNAGSTALTGWTVETGTVDTQIGDWNGSAYQFTGVPAGAQVLDLNTASISQSLATTAGMTYHISFALSENYAILHGGTVSVEVDFGSTSQSFTFSDAAGSTTNMRWDAHSFDATATGSATTLRIKTTGGANWAGGPMLDAVQVQTPSVFTSGSNVQTWDPIFPAAADPTWPTTSCTMQPAVGLNAAWQNPHNAFVVPGHPWANSYFQAPWINAWNSLPSQGPAGQSYTKYQTTVAGNGTFVIQLLADNCSWVYLDNSLVGVQNTNLDAHSYNVTLNGTSTLTFIIFDGGGAAGGKFRLETTQSYTDNGGNLSTVGTITPTDNTPPSITSQLTGTLGANDWYTSAVGVKWTVADNESAVSSTTGCDASTVSSDTPGTSFTCSATSAGGTASKSVTVKRDATPPSISGVASTTAWTNQNVTATFTCSDATSGVASCQSPLTVSAEGANQSVTGTATDNAGNGATATVGNINIDKTAPVVTYAGNAGSYTVDQTVAITCSATDALSGVASSNCANVSGDAYSFTIGNNSYSARATDNAGNVGHNSTAFTVQVTPGSLCALVDRWVSQHGVANSMCQELNNGAYGAFQNHVRAQSGKTVSAAHAAILIALAGDL